MVVVIHPLNLGWTVIERKDDLAWSAERSDFAGHSRKMMGLEDGASEATNTHCMDEGLLPPNHSTKSGIIYGIAYEY